MFTLFWCNLGKGIFLVTTSRLHTVTSSKKCASLPMFWKTKVRSVKYYNHYIIINSKIKFCFCGWLLKQQVQYLLDHCVVFLEKRLHCPSLYSRVIGTSKLLGRTLLIRRTLVTDRSLSSILSQRVAVLFVVLCC